MALDFIQQTREIKVKNKKIKFYPMSKGASVMIEPPQPAIKKIPDWYKNTEANYLKNKKLFVDQNLGTSLTIKACMPVFDAMTSGYFVTLPCDIQIVDKPEEFNNNKIMWRADFNVLGTHPQWQMGELHIPDEYDRSVFKWFIHWKIKVPDGYSVMVMHPSYRFDLPFFTLPAIVDLDSYDSTFNCPFFVRKDFCGIVEKGTPIAQIIPFKRDSWESTIQDYDQEDIEFSISVQKLKLSKYYKNNSWKRKIFK